MIDSTKSHNKLTKSTSGKLRVNGNKNWDRDVLPEIQRQQRIHKEKDIPATVRGLMYICESQDIIKKSDYGSLSKHLVAWRESGDIQDDWIVDKTRRIMDIIYYDTKGRRILIEYDENIQSFDDLITPPQHIKCAIDYLRDSPNDYYDNIPTSLGQTKYQEWWVEKDAMASVVYSIVKKGGVQVVVCPNRGWSSWTFAKDNLERLLTQKRKGKEVWIKYLGDSDPSGERMTAPDSDMVRMLKSNGIHFERLAITEQIIKDFKMQKIQQASMNDPGTQAKLEGTANKKGDPNTPWFKYEHKTPRAWQIEVDALQLDLDKFTNLILSSVKRDFSTDVQIASVQQVKDWYPRDEFNFELKRQVRDFARELGLDCH